MKHLIYLHGFLSSPASAKAQYTHQYLAKNRQDIRFHCPALSSKPRKDWLALKKLVSVIIQDWGLELARSQIVKNRTTKLELGIIGSSLGGFWASCLMTYLSNPTTRQSKHDDVYRVKSCLINPAVRPQQLIRDRINQKIAFWHGPGHIYLRPCDALALTSLDTRYASRSRLDSDFKVLLQKADETLDYRKAVSYYGAANCEIQSGGSHAFDGFNKQLPDLLQYLFPS